MKKTITSFVVAIIKKDNKYLLTKRQEIDREDPKDFVGKWQLPGGGVNFGETIENALIREVKEEVGLDIRIISVIPYIINSVRKGWHGIGIILACGLLNSGQSVKLNEESSEFAWFTLEELLKLNTLPGVKEAIKAASKSE